MALYSIPGRADGDAFWRYQTQEHAPAVLRVCGDSLVKYAINRVIDLTKGTTRFFGVVRNLVAGSVCNAGRFSGIGKRGSSKRQKV